MSARTHVCHPQGSSQFRSRGVLSTGGACLETLPRRRKRPTERTTLVGRRLVSKSTLALMRWLSALLEEGNPEATR
eukprot:5152745-Pyramimonas_sp.AAC.1